MTIENNTNKDGKSPEQGPKDTSGLTWVFVGGGFAWLVLMIVATYHPGITARVKFFSDSSLSLFLLLAVIAQVLIYRKQWKSMDASLAVARDALRIGERPVVGIRSNTLKTPLLPDEFAQTQIVWENSGRASARHCQVATVLDFKRDREPRPFFEPSQKPSGSRTLAINGERRSYAATFEPLSEQDIRDIEEDRAWIFAYASLDYDNGRGDSYFTYYCGLYHPQTGLFGEVGDFNDAS